MTVSHTQAAPAGLRSLMPGVVGASAFACADVLGKVILVAGGDVLTLLSVRGVAGLVFLAAWLRLGAKPVAFSPRDRWIALGIGLLFAITIFCLFKAFDVMNVSTAILAYFIYPLLTGLVAALTGLERLGWRGGAAAIVVFIGLALIVGARPSDLAFIGVVFSLAAAVSRAAMLVVTRALMAHADARLLTWYSMLSSTALFVVISLATRTWHPPLTGVGWGALAAISIVTVVAILAVFVSTNRIGPFRTALAMNLEPPITALGGALVLGDVITPVQIAGGVIMLTALVAFQLRR